MRKSLPKKLVKRAVPLAVILNLILANPQGAFAYSDAVVFTPNGKSFFSITFADQGDKYLSIGNDKQINFLESRYTISPRYKDAIGAGLQYWADILGPQSQNTKPLQVLVVTIDQSTAYGGTGGSESSTLDYAAAIQNGKLLKQLNLTNPQGGANEYPLGAYAEITMGKYIAAAKKGSEFDWYIDTDTLLPENEQANDFIGTIRHEMGHVLGIASSGSNKKENENPSFGDYPDNVNSFDAHLVDQNGNSAKPNMKIITTERFNEIKQADPTAKAEDYFILDLDKEARFVGKHVSEVLDGATLGGKNGLPISGWEYNYDSNNNKYYYTELSHLQTPGMMSHLDYTNYTTFMEAELAVIQDLGYAIDRKNFFGYSAYGDGRTIINRNGYSARNAAGTAYLPGVYNATSLGMGLHIYGSNNNITQAADILTVGKGSAGIRIDGQSNTLAVDRQTAIKSNGYRGIGVLVAFGTGHTISQDGTVTADGDGGVGIRFDFGSSSMGARDKYRGSYIHYERIIDYDVNTQISTGKIIKAKNIAFPKKAEQNINGALVNNYNLNGYLSGKANAIYIGKNAFVKNININNGAVIKGDITSTWKHFATDEKIYDGDGAKREILQIQYGQGYDYDDYIPDLVTNLNFNGSMEYDGKISGSDNMKLNVASPILRYFGTADVVNVNVAKDATLLGGTYTVNRQQYKNSAIRTAGDAADTGNFISTGTIGAINKNGTITDMVITAKPNTLGNSGTFSADGNILFTANLERFGQIKVNNFAKTSLGQNSGLNLTFDPSGIYIPYFNYDTKQIVLVNGAPQLVNFAAAADYRTGMMTATYDQGDSKITFKSANNLGETNQRQQQLFDVIEKIRSNNSNLNRAYAPLYSLPAGSAKNALTEIYGGMQHNLATAVQQDRYLGDTVFNRLSDPKRTDSEIWADIQKQWNAWGEGKVKDQIISGSIGIDRRINENWIWGGILAYGKHQLNADIATGTIHGLKLGVYGGYQENALNVDTYFAYGKQNQNSDRALPTLGLNANSKYSSNTLSLGVKAGYDLQYKKNTKWHTVPYAELLMDRYSQDSFSESGAGVYNQNGHSYNDTIVTGGLGLEFKRDLQAKGSYAVKLGYRSTLSGDNKAIPTSFVVDNKVVGISGSGSDRNVFTIGLKGKLKLRDNVTLGGELAQDWGKTTDNLRLAVNLKWEY